MDPHHNGDAVCGTAGPEPATGDKKAVSGTYRNKVAKDGFPNMDAANLYDMFHQSVKRNPDAPCLGWRPVVKGKAGAYEWLTYKQVRTLNIQHSDL